MTPIKWNLTAWQGKTFEEPFFFADSNKNVTNLGGYTARMQVRETIDAADVIIELTTENDRITIDGDRGLVTLYLEDEDTAELPTGSFKYDLELVTASGRVYGPLYGSFKVKAEVTRA